MCHKLILFNNCFSFWFRRHPQPKRIPYHYYKPRGPDECLTYLQNEKGRRGNHHRFITEKQVFARWAKLYNISFVHPTWWEMDSKRLPKLSPADPIWPPAQVSAQWDADLKWQPAKISFQWETVTQRNKVWSNMAHSFSLPLRKAFILPLSQMTNWSKMVSSFRVSNKKLQKHDHLSKLLKWSQMAAYFAQSLKRD